MKIYLMTDLEGVAGVLDFDNWCTPSSRYYETAKEFLTLEVNAAVEGLFAGGAREIVVADGHGCGALNVKLLDPRVRILRGWTCWPLLLDKSYDAVVVVGQHAKAGTEYAHLAHTQYFGYLDLSVNGVSIGEFGQFAMCASELGIRTIFASGDEAFTKEARALVPGMETVAVKVGTTAGKGDECTEETYGQRNIAAIHLHPIKARELIKEGCLKAIQRAQKENFGLIPLKPPFELVAIFRPNAKMGKRMSKAVHPTSFAGLMNIPCTETTNL